MPPRNSHCKWLSWLGIFAFLQSVGMFWSMHCDLYYHVSLLCPGVISAQERILRTPLASSPRWLPQPSPALDGSSVSGQRFSLCANTEWTCAQAPHTQDAPHHTHAPLHTRAASLLCLLICRPHSSQSASVHRVLAPLLTAQPSSCWNQPVLRINPSLGPNSALYHFLPSSWLFRMGPSSKWPPYCWLFVKAQALEPGDLVPIPPLSGYLRVPLDFLNPQMGLIIFTAADLQSGMNTKVNHREHQNSFWHIGSPPCKWDTIILLATSRGCPNAHLSPRFLWSFYPSLLWIPGTLFPGPLLRSLAIFTSP